MKKSTNIQELFDFVSKKTDYKTIETFYRTNLIKKELLDFATNFIKALFRKMDETYFGYEFINDETDAENHFNWCFKTVSNEIKKIEGVYVEPKSLLADYLFDYSINLFYIPEDENRKNIEESLDYFEKALSMDYYKTQMDLELLKQLHIIFNLNLTKKQ